MLLPILRDNLSTMGFIVFVRLIDVSGQVPLGSPAGLQLGFSNEAFRFKEHRPGSQWGLVECRPICLGHLFFRLLFVIGLSTQAYLVRPTIASCGLCLFSSPFLNHRPGMLYPVMDPRKPSPHVMLRSHCMLILSAACKFSMQAVFNGVRFAV